MPKQLDLKSNDKGILEDAIEEVKNVDSDNEKDEEEKEEKEKDKEDQKAENEDQEPVPSDTTEKANGCSQKARVEAQK